MKSGKVIGALKSYERKCVSQGVFVLLFKTIHLGIKSRAQRCNSII